MLTVISLPGLARTMTAAGGVADPVAVVLLAALTFLAIHCSSNPAQARSLLLVKKLALLLRGINVGSNNRLSMADLREVLSDLGYEEAQTLLNSGNAIITTDHTPDKAERRVQKALKGELGLPVEVLARTHDELAAILTADPFKDVSNDASRYAVAFLRSAPVKAGLDALAAVNAAKYHPEQWQLIDRELYVWYANGQARTKLTGQFWEKTLKVAATARNWNTVEKLCDLTAP
jgi:uncharacterized protein (DUF1697 family)